MSHSPLRSFRPSKIVCSTKSWGLEKRCWGLGAVNCLEESDTYVCMYIYVPILHERNIQWVDACCKMLKHYLQLSLGLEHGFGHFTPLDLSGCCLGDLGHNPDLQTDCQTLVCK